MSSLESIGKPIVKPNRLNSAFKQLMSLHWWMALAYLVLFIGGTLMAPLPKEHPIRNPLYDFHKSIGALTMAMLTLRILVLLRVWWRKYTKKHPKLTAQWFKNFILHITLYLFMWAVPITGFFLSNSVRIDNVRFFGIVLPNLFLPNPERVPLARSIHFWFTYTFLVFILLHMILQWKVMRANWKRFTQFVQKSRA